MYVWERARIVEITYPRKVAAQQLLKITYLPEKYLLKS
jgi:hypothetical protein